ncbi:MAG: hypothetical protein R6U70_03795 [Bacillota bacterium]
MAERTVVGVFSSRDNAERAVEELRNRGWDRDISILAREEGRQGRQGGDRGQMENQDLSEGVATGGVLGGLAGLAASAGLMTIPGVGPVLAAGPIATTLTGVVTGGLAGGLVDYGIPAEEGRQYEEEVKRGRILTMVRTEDRRASDVERILRERGADRVKSH